MTDVANERLLAEGWHMMHDDGFINLVGPMWQRAVGDRLEFAIVGQDKHRNRRGVVQGGLLMTLADRSCGMGARHASGAPNLATVQLDTHFVDAAQIGEIVVSRPLAVRTTKSLIFMKTDIMVGDRCVAAAVGVFKVVSRPDASRSAAD